MAVSLFGAVAIDIVLERIHRFGMGAPASHSDEDPCDRFTWPGFRLGVDEASEQRPTAKVEVAHRSIHALVAVVG
ncbi:MAG: hypothetical protein L0K74_09325 [Acidipropionibacterium acidipropionici]|nr:hypothetical protein [Acidipropionibacterium acidipropionici]